MEGSIISSVVPPITPVIRTALRKITGKTAIVLGPGTKTGLSIRIDDPSSVGADLVAGAAGALAKYQPPLIVIDMGTATTLSVVDRERNYIGGAIMPGLRLNLNSLVSGTSMLRGISLDIPKHAIGHNTVDAMRSGIMFGYYGLIKEIVARMKEELGGDALVIATGGFGNTMAQGTDCIDEVDQMLTLEGLRLIFEKNKK